MERGGRAARTVFQQQSLGLRPSNTFLDLFQFFLVFVFNICFSLGNWGVKEAICKILEILDQN